MKVLKYSLILESLASKVLASLLNIKNSKDSYSLGNKSTCLSFNQKINLLVDNQSVTKDEKFKLESFASIRNQFMHNGDANTFVEAFNLVNGLLNKFKKIYPENFESNSLEKALEKCIDCLYIDCLKILAINKGGRLEKLNLEVDAKFYKESFDKLNKSIDLKFEEFEKALDSIQDDNIDTENLKETLRIFKMEIFLDFITK